MHGETETNRPGQGRPETSPPGAGGRLFGLLAFFFGAFLFTSTFSISAAQISLGICVLLFAADLINKRRWPETPGLKPLFAVWAIYLLWLVIASLSNDNPLRSLSCIREEWLLVILPIGLHLTHDRIISRRLLMVLAVGVTLMAVYGIVQHFMGWYFFSSHGLHRVGASFRLSGSFSHPLTYGYYIVTATIFFLALTLGAFRRFDRVGRWVVASAAILGLLASALSNSRGPMLALVIGLMVVGLGIGRIRWAVLGLAILTVVAATLSPNLMSAFSQRVANDWNADNPSGRVFIWRQAGDVALENPLLGCGPGNFGAAYLASLPPELAGSGSKGHAHNDFIHQAAVAGFPAALLMIAFWGVALKRFWRLKRDSSLSAPQRAFAFAGLAASVTFLVGSMTECAFADEELRQLLMAVWAFSWNPCRSLD